MVVLQIHCASSSSANISGFLGRLEFLDESGGRGRRKDFGDTSKFAACAWETGKSNCNVSYLNGNGEHQHQIVANQFGSSPSQTFQPSQLYQSLPPQPSQVWHVGVARSKCEFQLRCHVLIKSIAWLMGEAVSARVGYSLVRSNEAAMDKHVVLVRGSVFHRNVEVVQCRLPL